MGRLSGRATRRCCLDITVKFPVSTSVHLWNDFNPNQNPTLKDTVYLKPSKHKKQAVKTQHFKPLSGGVVCHMLPWAVGTAVWVKQWKLNYSVAWKAELKDPAWAVVRVLFLVFRLCFSYCIFTWHRIKRKTLSFFIYPKCFHDIITFQWLHLLLPFPWRVMLLKRKLGVT